MTTRARDLRKTAAEIVQDLDITSSISETHKLFKFQAAMTEKDNLYKHIPREITIARDGRCNTWMRSQQASLLVKPSTLSPSLSPTDTSHSKDRTLLSKPEITHQANSSCMMERPRLLAPCLIETKYLISQTRVEPEMSLLTQRAANGGNSSTSRAADLLTQEELFLMSKVEEIEKDKTLSCGRNTVV